MIVDIQVLPSPSGNDERRWAHVEAAIAVIVASGLRYVVGPLGTAVEGEPDEVWPLVRAVHEATLRAGAEGVATIVKVEQTRDRDRQPSIDDLAGPYR